MHSLGNSLTNGNWGRISVNGKKYKDQVVELKICSNDFRAEVRSVFDLSGMCCGRTWWSSGVLVGSYPDTWPACPAWLLMSLNPSGRTENLLERSDLQVDRKTITAKIQKYQWSKKLIFCEFLPLLELVVQGSYLSIKALIWSCRKRGNSSSLNRESRCFSFRNLVKFSFVMVGLVELECRVKQWTSWCSTFSQSTISQFLGWTVLRKAKSQTRIILSLFFEKQWHDLLWSEDLKDFWSRTQICQEGLEGSFSEYVRLDGVILKRIRFSYHILLKKNKTKKRVGHRLKLGWI